MRSALALSALLLLLLRTPLALAQNGTQFPGSQTAGIQSTDPQSTDPQSTKSQPTDAQHSGPQTVDIQSTDLQPTKPQPTGPHPTGPHPTDAQPSGPQPSGPRPSGPQPSGPQPSGPQPSGSQPADAQPTKPQSTNAQPTGSQSTRPPSTDTQPSDTPPTTPTVSKQPSKNPPSTSERVDPTTTNQSTVPTSSGGDEKLVSGSTTTIASGPKDGQGSGIGAMHTPAANTAPTFSSTTITPTSIPGPVATTLPGNITTLVTVALVTTKESQHTYSEMPTTPGTTLSGTRQQQHLDSTAGPVGPPGSSTKIKCEGPEKPSDEVLILNLTKVDLCAQNLRDDKLVMLLCRTAKSTFNSSQDHCHIRLAPVPGSLAVAVKEVTIHTNLLPQDMYVLLKDRWEDLKEVGVSNIQLGSQGPPEETEDRFSMPLIITIVCMASFLLLVATLYGCCHQHLSQRKDQQRLTEELQTVENGYHDNPTLDVMETSSDMQEKKVVNLNGELGDSWIVPLDNLLKDDLDEEEDTHL